MRRTTTPLLVPALLAVLYLAACGDSEPPQVDSVSLTPAAVTMTALGQSQTLGVTVKDAVGVTISDATVTWSTSDATVALVDVNGEVTAENNGTATVTAHVTTSTAQKTGSAQVTVSQEAASVAVDAPVDSLLSGETAQFSAAAADANGFNVDRALAWSSSEEAVATVDQTGLVTAVGAGETVITAAMDGVEGTASLTARLVSVSVTADTTLSGTMVVDTFSVATGVTITATEDFVLQASGPMTVAGTITGDCVSMSLLGGDSVHVSGTLDNRCSGASIPDERPSVRIESDGPIVIDGATISAVGGILVGDSSFLSDTDTLAPALTEKQMMTRAEGLEGLQTCVIKGAEVGGLRFAEGERAPWDQGVGGIDVGCFDGMIVSGTVFTGANGADGRDANGLGSVEGGDGERGSSIRLGAGSHAGVFFSGAEGPTTINHGFGGDGGDATAAGTDPVATGGHGGGSGSLTLSGPRDMDEGALVIFQGRGGDGGGAFATADDGAEATATTPATGGGPAKAHGGTGGTQSGGGISITGTAPLITKAFLGRGGDAEATAGTGGAGSLEFPTGAQGGDAEARGGDAGSEAGRLLAPFTGEPNRGGDALFKGGAGGAGYSSCPAGTAGAGGVGGQASGAPGFGSWRTGVFVSDVLIGELPAMVILDGFGNGGAGGDGTSPGPGGAAGGDEIVVNAEILGQFIGPFSRQERSSPNFSPGPNGSGCDQQVDVDATVTVQDDPAGHEPFVNMTGVTSLIMSLVAGNQQQAALSLGTLTIAGNGNWISVTGTPDDDGNFTATGSGSAAGFSNVTVSLVGQLVIDGDGFVTGVSGTYTVGVNGELFGQPVYYTVVGS